MTEDTSLVLVIEDDPEMMQALCAACDDLGFTPLTATTFADGLALVQDKSVPLAILDRLLPDGDSVDMIGALRTEGQVGAVLMVSALAHAGHRSYGLDRGADDYLAKPFDPTELRARIRALVRRAKSDETSNDFLVFGALEIRIRARTVHFGLTHIPLSPKEFDLLHYFATNAGTPLSRMQLLEHVWNLHFDPQTNVVDVHVGRLRRKLEGHTGSDWIHTARGTGYWFGLAPDAPSETPA